MALKIKWSRFADKSFDHILEYMESEWGENVTRKFVRRTYEFTDILSEFPELGSIENSEKQIRGFVLVKQITVFYSVKNNLIIILNFYDNRQKPW